MFRPKCSLSSRLSPASCSKQHWAPVLAFFSLPLIQRTASISPPASPSVTCCCKPQMPMGPVTEASGLWGGELSCWRALWGHTFILGSREALVFEWLQLWLLNLDTWRIAQKSSWFVVRVVSHPSVLLEVSALTALTSLGLSEQCKSPSVQSVCTVPDLIHVGVLLVEKAVKGVGTAYLHWLFLWNPCTKKKCWDMASYRGNDSRTLGTR